MNNETGTEDFDRHDFHKLKEEYLEEYRLKYLDKWGADILNECIQEEIDSPRFKRKEARVSAVGLCQKRAVAGALGKFQTNIPFEYVECGFSLQSRAMLRYKSKFKNAEEEVTVNTAIPGVKTHPDILIPEIKLCIQVKTTGDKKFEKGPGLKPHYEDQCLLEWQSWQRSKYCITETGKRIDIIPERYEVLYLGRETYGKFRKSYPIKWQPVRARALEDKLIETQNYIELGIIPEKPFKSPQWECLIPGYPPCPLYEECWGKKEEKKSYRNTTIKEDDPDDKWWER